MQISIILKTFASLMKNKLRQQIIQLEKVARQLEPSAHQREQWMRLSANFAAHFIDHLPEEPAYKSKPPLGGFQDLPLPQQGRSMEEALEFLQQQLLSSGLNPASGGHLGYIPGGGIYTTALGDFLAAITNAYAGISFAGPGAVRMENSLLRWMCNLIGYPKTALGNLTSGGSIANLIAITTAREAKNISCHNIPRQVIYLTKQAHHSIQKAINIAGLREAPIRYVPMDKYHRMSPEALEKQIVSDIRQGLRPFLLIAAAGTTDTGAMDPLNQLADIAEKYNLWLHVDAAYGGFFIMVDQCKHLFKGIERSDSVTIDPHKGLFLSYGLGAVLVKDLKAMHQAHRYKANYMQDAVKTNPKIWDPAELSPELTKHFRGLRLWLSLQLNGLQRFKTALTEKYLLAHYFYQEVQKLGFETGPKPSLSVVLYRYIPHTPQKANEFNRRLLEHLHNDGRIFVSSTMIDQTFWLRFAVLSFRTHLRELELFLDMLKEGLTLTLKET